MVEQKRQEKKKGTQPVGIKDRLARIPQRYRQEKIEERDKEW